MPNKGKKRNPKGGKPRKKGGNMGSEVGRALGGMVGMPGVGATLGNLAHSVIGKLFGRGDYGLSPESVSENTFVHPTQRDVIPKFATDNGYVEVAHREFLADLEIGPNETPFVANYVINPASYSTFPWLSQIAYNFEQYKMLGLVFEYRPTCGAAVSSTNSALGSVNFVTHYNVNNLDFSTKKQVLNHFFATGTVPSSGMLHPVECASEQTPTNCLFVRGGENTAPNVVSDARFYDLGRLQIFNLGAQARFTCGELWVSYHILLIKPRLNPFLQGVLVVDYNGGTLPPDPPSENHVPELQLIPECEEKKDSHPPA